MNIEKRTNFLKEILTTEEFNEVNMDKNALQNSLEYYNEKYINSMNVFAIKNKRFLILKDDMPKLHKEWLQTLEKLSNYDTLVNPVYIEVDVNGTMLVS